MRPDPQRLAALPLFSSLSPEQLQALATFTTIREQPAGTRVVEEGASGYAFFIVEQGTAVVTSGERELEVLGPGDFFGEICVKYEGWRTATVTATSPLTVIVMLGRDCLMFERECSHVADALQKRMAERLERSAQLGQG